MKTARVLVGTPTVEPDARFMASLPSFLYEASDKYDVCHKFIRGKDIYQAHTELAETALINNFDYLLILEDDHWGFTFKMLDHLIQSKHPMCGYAYYSRHYPYLITTMKKIKYRMPKQKDVFNEVKHDYGFHEVDLLGFGFCLFDVKLFAHMQKPWFKATHFERNATDKFFCDKLKKEMSISPVACFDYIINHRDITKENVFDRRTEMTRLKKLNEQFVYA